jgi:hypothetical protein
MLFAIAMLCALTFAVGHGVAIYPPLEPKLKFGGLCFFSGAFSIADIAG